MAKLRNDCNKNFTIINNYILQSCFVSLKAIGMYAKLVSLPDNWKFTEEGLISICKESKTVVRSAINELEELNLLFRFQAKSDDGRFAETIYYISSEPMTEEEKQQITGNEQNVKMLGKSKCEPIAQNQISENRISENVPQLNTNILNTNILNIKERKKETSYDEIISEFNFSEEVKKEIYEFIKMRKMKKKPLTDRALKIQLNKLMKLSTNEEEQIRIIDKSVVSCWDEFYELKENQKQNGWNYLNESKSSNPFFDILKEEGKMQ